MHKGMCGRKDNPPGSAKQDKTLADYLERKGFFKQVPENQDHMFPKKKLTFDEWLKTSSFIEPDMGTYLWLKDCWKTAQENTPSQAPGAQKSLD